MASKKQITYWRKQIELTQTYMRPKHKLWRRLLKQYELEELHVEGMEDDQVVKVSRFYPLVRQITAAVAFHYPKIFMVVDDEPYERASNILEEAANTALNIMKTREEVHQIIFDTLFCGVGWIKHGVNPMGDDTMAPYVANDDLQDGFPFTCRVNPFNLFIDPITPPHRFGHARYIIERMIVPLEFIKEDKRYKNRAEIKASANSLKPEDEILEDMEGRGTTDAERALEQTLEDGEMVTIWEIHDRIHRKRLTFAQGVEEPIEEIDHPFLQVEPVTQPDPITGQPVTIGYQRGKGYIVESGFPYSPLKFDTSDQAFVPVPPLAYVEDIQERIQESVSRRVDILKRYSRLILGLDSERQANPELDTQLKDAEDGTVLWVKQLGSFQELQWGNIPNDQLGIESDMRNYEEQMLHVSELNAGAPRRTATEASLLASAGSINREWLQSKIAELYRLVTTNTLSILGDPRYSPDAQQNPFVIHLRDEATEEAKIVLERAHFMAKFRVEVVAGSMQPLIEQLEQENTLAIADRLFQHPDLIDRTAVLKMVLAAGRVPDQDKLLSTAANADAIRAAQLENEGWLVKGGDPDVTPGEDHRIHMQVHQQKLQELITQLSQGQQTQDPNSPQMQQLVQSIQLFQQHLQQHEQALAQAAQQLGGGAVNRQEAFSGNNAPLESVVESNAQRVQSNVEGEATPSVNGVQ